MIHLCNSDINKNISEVINSGLCTGCGTCVGMCPNSALKMVKHLDGVYIPLTNIKKCNHCNICINTCPVNFNDVNVMNSTDLFLGNHLNCYIGHSTHEQLRWNSSSGGLITALLIFALEKGIIKGAVVSRMNRKKPLEPEVILAKTREEIISASGSKYCPVPVNIALKKVLKENGKFAIVGLPCHFQGLKKAEKINKKLKEKIILRMGLFCGSTPTFLGNEFLFKRLGTSKEDITSISYRGLGWPGFMTINLNNRKKMSIPFFKYWTILGSPLFTSKHCMLCNDLTNEYSDISFGDAWLPELKNNRIGMSIVVSRTKIGEDFLREAESEVIKISKTDCNDVIRSQRRKLNYKKKNLATRIRVWKLLGHKTPNYDFKRVKPSNLSCLDAMLRYLIMYISSNSYLRNSLIYRQPYLLPEIYRFIYRVYNVFRKDLMWSK